MIISVSFSLLEKNGTMTLASPVGVLRKPTLFCLFTLTSCNRALSQPLHKNRWIMSRARYLFFYFLFFFLFINTVQLPSFFLSSFFSPSPLALFLCPFPVNHRLILSTPIAHLIHPSILSSTLHTNLFVTRTFPSFD